MSDDPLLKYLARPTRRRFATLVRARRDLVLQAAFRVLADTASAEDVAQEVFAKLLSSRPAPGDVRSPRGLLTVMTVNAARTRLRSRGRRAAHEREAAVRRREAEMKRDGMAIGEVRDAVEALPDPLRECVSLRYFGALSLDEVAAELGVSRRTVNGRLKEGRDRLREALGAPAYGSVLALVAGESEEGFPETDVSAGFRSRTEELIRRAELPAGLPTGPLAWVGAAAVLGVVLLAGLHGSGLFDGEAAGAPSAPGAGDAESGRKQPVAGRAGSRDAGAGNDEASQLVSDESDPDRDGGVGLKVEVVDESGNLLRSGRLEIDLFGFPPEEVLAALRPWKKLLDGVDLSKSNPVEVRDLPAVVDGLTVLLRATAPGRPPGERIRVELDGHRVLEHRFVLPLPRELRIAILDRVTGRPVEGARVASLTELDRREIVPEEPGIGPGRNVTDASGAARLTDLGAGPHEVAVRAEGYREIVLDEVELGADVRIELSPLGPVGGVRVTVTGPTGAPAKGVKVTLSIEGGGLPRVAESDAKGVVEFASVPTGFHYVKLDFDDWFEVLRAWGGEPPEDTAFSQLVKLERNEVFEAKLGCLRGSGLITATVVDPEGDARPGITVRISGDVLREGVTDKHGAVTFRELPSGDYRASLKSESGGWDWSLTKEASLAAGGRLDLRLVSGTAVLRGRVLLPTGRSASRRFFVSALGPAFDMVPVRGDGSFEFRGVPPGTYSIGVGLSEFAAPRVTVTVAAKGPAEAVEIAMVRGGRILIDFAKADRARLSGAEVRLLDADDRELSVDRDESGAHDRLSHALYPGAYRVEARLPGGKTIATAVEIEDGKDEVVTLTLD